MIKLPLVAFAGIVLTVSLTGAAPAPWGSSYLRKAPDWYASEEALTAAENVIRYQSPEGAWPKNMDLAAPPTPERLREAMTGRSANTIDNDATTAPLRFMAKVGQAAQRAEFLESAERGIDYLLAAQYENGGFPQIYPLRSNYSAHITYNDGAMINALETLRAVAGGEPPFQFVDETRRSKAKDAVERGIDCILRTQIVHNGHPAVWCAQHDETTLEPAWARNFEPPSFSGGESVGIVRFLMEIEDPAPEVIEAIEGAIAWFQDNAIHGKRLETYTSDDGERERRVVEDANAPPMWARFYELETLRPLFVGRDRVFHYELSAIERERRMGYSYLGAWPATLLNRDYPAWRQRVGLDDSNTD